MKRLVVIFMAFNPVASWSQAEFVTDSKPQAVFAGSQSVRATFRNPGIEATKTDLRFRLYQASASTLMPLSDTKSWKTIDLPASQTVVEQMTLELPPTRGETVMQIAWFDGQRKLGSTRLQVFPAGLLKPLATLAGDSPLALLDLEDRLKPAFQEIPVKELKDSDDLDSSEASLIIIAPVSPERRPAGLTAAVKRKAEAGRGIVWIQAGTLTPIAAYLLSESSGHIVVGDAATVANFATSPLAQLALVHMAELAVGRRKLELPADPQP
jgi:hypothetical protein